MTLRRSLAGVALLAATALVATACGGDDASDEESASDAATEATEEATDEAAAGDFPEGSTMAAIVEAGELRVGTTFDQPGFGLANLDGDPEGFDVEVATIVAAATSCPNRTKNTAVPTPKCGAIYVMLST